MGADIFLTNTLTKTKEKFVPIEAGKVKIYSCGPTVYDFAHIGNFRSFMMSDLLYRVFKYAGYQVQKVQNITDVGHLTDDDLADAEGDDKILKKAKAEKKDPFEIARNFENFFIEDEEKLRILAPNAGRPRATDFIPEQIAICKELIKNGFAYQVNGSVYFRTAKFEDYGKLSKNDLKDLISGARVEVNSEKEDPLDFALWKHADAKHLMQWDYETGKRCRPEDQNPNAGFPGWHIECSAMSRKLLGKNFDIHTGGEDNIFPHHECEIAQNECAFHGKINYWLHGKHLLVDGKKMSKSKGNFYTVRDIFEKGYSGTEIRYLFLSAHYRTALNFTFDGLDMARNSIARIVEARRVATSLVGKVPTVKPTTDYYKKLSKEFGEALFDDLNISKALSFVFEKVNSVNKQIEDHRLETRKTGVALTHFDGKKVSDFLYFLENDFDPVFDIFPEKKTIDANLEKEIEAKIKERDTARADKDWELSDQIRDALADKGIELIDEGGKTSWKVK